MKRQYLLLSILLVSYAPLSFAGRKNNKAKQSATTDNQATKNTTQPQEQQQLALTTQQEQIPLKQVLIVKSNNDQQALSVASSSINTDSSFAETHEQIDQKQLAPTTQQEQTPLKQVLIVKSNNDQQALSVASSSVNTDSSFAETHEQIDQKQLALTTQQEQTPLKQVLIVKSNNDQQALSVASSSINTDSSFAESYEQIDPKTLNEALQALRQPQFPLGTFDAEINKGFLTRLFWEPRHVREKTEQMIKTYDPKKYILGTGDDAELKRLIIAARDSYLDHNQPHKLAVLVTFITQQKTQGFTEEFSQERVLKALEAEKDACKRKVQELQPLIKPLKEEAQRLTDITCEIEKEAAPISAALLALGQPF